MASLTDRSCHISSLCDVNNRPRALLSIYLCHCHVTRCSCDALCSKCHILYCNNRPWIAARNCTWGNRVSYHSLHSCLLRITWLDSGYSSIRIRHACILDFHFASTTVYSTFCQWHDVWPGLYNTGTLRLYPYIAMPGQNRQIPALLCVYSTLENVQNLMRWNLIQFRLWAK